ncbi:MAG: hypothetical protein K2P81_09050 [Bacteriovoracaceae bacterium]|nr:hypothetical protein [Bacteriovoracaceae bacterium]
MSGDEDDKATVVIDINALKKEKENKEKQISELASELEFNAEGSGEVISAPRAATVPILLFDFGTKIFDQFKSSIPSRYGCTTIPTLPELNGHLKKKSPLVLVFAFDSNPKAINQLCAQLKTKFKHVHTVIIAKNLSPEKVKLHQSSPAGAAAYIKSPFTESDFSKALDPLISKIAS